MRISRIIILTFVISALTGCATVRNVLPGGKAGEQKPVTTSPAELKDAYQTGARQALEPYWTNANGVQARAKLLDLKVPTEYLDVHLKLVIAFDKLEQGKAATDQARIEEAMDTINQLATEYPWLKQ